MPKRGAVVTPRRHGLKRENNRRNPGPPHPTADVMIAEIDGAPPKTNTKKTNGPPVPRAKAAIEIALSTM